MHKKADTSPLAVRVDLTTVSFYRNDLPQNLAVFNLR